MLDTSLATDPIVHPLENDRAAAGLLNIIDGFMAYDVTPFSTVFPSYSSDGRMIMKGCVEWNLVYGWKNFCLEPGSNPRPLFISRTALNLLSYWGS